MNIAEFLVQSGCENGSKPAIAIGRSAVLTYSDLSGRAAAIAFSLLRDFNLQAGDRVALCAANRLEYLEILYACWIAGLVPVPINAKLHPSEVDYILENCGAELVFMDRGTSPSQVAKGIEIGGPEYEEMLAHERLSLTHVEPDDPAWIFYTSGTTGKPKGATLSHRNLAAMCECYLHDVNPQPEWPAILHAAPMSHGSGLYALAHVMKASCHVIPEGKGFDPEEIFNLIEAWPGISFFAAPTMVKRLLDHPATTDLTNLQAVLYGGGPMYLEDSLAATERFGARLSQLYGQGESPMTITALNAGAHGDTGHPRYLERLASVGVAQSAVDVIVADDQDKILPVGEVGEILVQGETVMLGYWENEAASKKALRNGWLHTGDFGAFDEDGFLTLKDRGSDLIISGGSNIYPREVEEVLLSHETVAEVSVIGRPDREWGEIVVAYIVPVAGSMPAPNDLDALCVSQIARFKRPKDYRFLESLPKNNYGKVLKTELRALEKSGR